MFVFNLAYANLRITPAVVNINAEPMALCENKYVVTNVDENTVTVTVTKEDWKKIRRGSNWLAKAGTTEVTCIDGVIIVNPFH